MLQFLYKINPKKCKRKGVFYEEKEYAKQKSKTKESQGF